MLALDLGVFNRKAHEISIIEALILTAVWIMLAMCFSGTMYYRHGEVKAAEFLAGYVIEKALSVDNIFVFVLFFSCLKYQRFISIKFCFGESFEG
jgi:tellurite resistance protein TerC